MGGRILVDSFLKIYTQHDLVKLIRGLTRQANIFNDKFALSLASEDHIISLCYQNSRWIFIDINHTLKQPILFNTAEDIELITCLIAFHVWNAFGNQNLTAFHTNLFSTTADNERTKAFALALHEDKDFKILFEASPQDGLLKSENDITLTWLAARCNHVDTLKKLIAINSPIDLNTAYEKTRATPAYMAAQNGHADIMQILVNLKTSEGELAVDLNKADKEGATPAFIAAQNGHANIIKILSEVKNIKGECVVNFNLAYPSGETPAFIAAQNGYSEIIKILSDLKNLKGGSVVDLNQANQTGMTLALIAVANGYTEIIKILARIKTGKSEPVVDFNWRDKEGWTIAHVAAYLGRLEILQVLANNGVNLNPLNKGLTPLDLAKNNENSPVVSFLEAWNLKRQLQLIKYPGDHLSKNDNALFSVKKIIKENVVHERIGKKFSI